METSNLKKHSGTSPQIQSKELTEKLRSTLPDQQINASKSTNKISKNLKQSNKLNKNILIAKTLEASTPQAKFDLDKHTYFKRNFFCLKSVQDYICNT